MDGNDAGLYKKLAHVLWMMYSYSRRNLLSFLPGMNPHQGQGRVLALLRLQPEISQKDLAFLLAIRPQSLGELLGKLEQRGYITRTPSQQDRRIIIIQLTEAGYQAAQRQDEAPDSPQGFFDCLSADEQDALERYLDKIIFAMKQRGAEKEKPAFPFGSRETGTERQKRARGYVNFDWTANSNGWQFGVRRGHDGNDDEK